MTCLRLAPRLLVLLVLLCGREALAYDFQVEAQVIGQGYQLRAADNSIVDRRRLTTYLGLSVWGLGPRDREGVSSARNQWNITLSLRFDTDLGDYLCNIGRPSFAAPLTCLSGREGASNTSPELSNNRPELLFGYVEGKNLFGWMDLRLGRQIQWELFDLRAFDGALVEIHTPVYVAAQLFGGLNINGALPIDSPIYSLDGTSRRPLSDAPQQSEALQPMVGFALRSYGFRDVQAQLTYRRSFSLAADTAPAGCTVDQAGNRAACAPVGLGTIEERISYSLRGRVLDGRLIAWGGLRYDFVSGRFDEGNAGVRGYLNPQHALSLEYIYNAPTWDGDSIFNVFASSPFNDLRLSWDGRFGPFRSHARLFGRQFEELTAHGGGTPVTTPATYAYGGTAGVRYDRAAGFVRLDAYYDDGYGGQRTGTDVAGRLMLFRNALGLEGRLTYMYFVQDLRPENATHSFGMQLGARYAITRGILLHVLFEDNINRFYNSAMRVMALLDMSFFFGGHTGGSAPFGLSSAGMGMFPGRI